MRKWSVEEITSWCKFENGLKIVSIMYNAMLLCHIINWLNYGSNGSFGCDSASQYDEMRYICFLGSSLDHGGVHAEFPHRIVSTVIE